MERKLFQGTADRRFSPNEPMTRAMAAQILYHTAQELEARKNDTIM